MNRETLSKIFKTAHQMARQVIQLGDDYRATFALALREAFKAVVSTSSSLVDCLLRIGKLWEKGDHRRIYFFEEVLMKAAGLKISRYGTGNVSGASLDGDKISNAKGSKLASEISLGRLHYDIVRETFSARMSDALMTRIVESLKARS